MTIELVEEFRRQGCDVVVFCPFHDARFIYDAFKQDVEILVSAAQIRIDEFDFIYTHHQMPSRFMHDQSLDCLCSPGKPVFIYNHLSPFEAFEYPGPACEAIFADIILCNSTETARKLAEFGNEYAGAKLFPNPAPAHFESQADSDNKESLESVLAVSNHIPKEVAGALDLLRDNGINVNTIGKPDQNRRILPTDLFEHDAVITIGKTVQYALRAHRPAFCYDWFQGPGWLNEETFDAAAELNFSGRCTPKVRSSEELAGEILSGYCHANAFSRSFASDKLMPFNLEYQVSSLIGKIVDIRSQENNKPFPDTAESLKQKLLIEKEMYSLLDREYSEKRKIQKRANNILQLKQLDTPANIETGILRTPEQGEACVVAVFAYRYDAHLVPALLENISPFVHAWVAWDDRSVNAQFTGDAQRRSALFHAAKNLGADWILAADPDERYESALAGQIRELTNDHGPVCWTFNCRELFEPGKYRVDGFWNHRPRVRLFPCLTGMDPDAQEFHSSWTRNDAKIPTRSSSLNFYHLRMITPQRRQHRRDVYAAADPDRKCQAIGYDYLCDDRGMQLECIPDGREYSPAHNEDGGLWAPDIEDIGAPLPDPFNVKLRRLETTIRQGGASNGAYLAEDLYNDSKQDLEHGLRCAELHLRAGNFQAAGLVAGDLATRYPGEIFPQLLLSRIQSHLGKVEAAHITAKRAQHIAPESLVIETQVLRTLPATERFRVENALWRRWVRDAGFQSGTNLYSSNMCVVVIGYRAPPELASAVSSLLEQDVQPEIVVVNSGGGDAHTLLAEFLDQIRLITVEERLYAGAARNIGIDASSAPYIAFLASDCVAKPGWVRHRLEYHRKGAGAVASAVIPEHPENLASIAAHYLMHWRRRPVPDTEPQTRYGVSCARWVFETCGYFPVGLRIGEDSRYNELLRNTVGIAWAPEVVSTHRYPTSPENLVTDMHTRGQRRAQYAPFANIAGESEFREFVGEWSKVSINNAITALEQSGSLSQDKLETVKQLIKQASESDVDGIYLGWMQVCRARDIAAHATSETAQQAIESLEEAISIWHQNDAIHMQLGKLLAANDTVAVAATAGRSFRKAASLSPERADANAEICAMHVAAGNNAAALAQAELACITSPLQAALWWKLNAIAGSLGLLALQIYAVQQVVLLNPSNPAAHSTLANLHRRAGNTTVADLRAALQEKLAEPDRSEARATAFSSQTSKKVEQKAA